MAMSQHPSGCLIPELSRQPTAALLHGDDRPLLNWVLYAILVRATSDYAWTDVRMEGEALDPLDPLARGMIPPKQLNSVGPHELGPVVGAFPNLADMPWEVSPTETEKAVESLQFPAPTQQAIKRSILFGRVNVFGLSNAHRLSALFSPRTIRTTLDAIKGADVSLVITWADALPEPSGAIDFLLRIEGAGAAEWRDARLEWVRGESKGPTKVGETRALGDIPEVADVLGPLLRGRR